MQKFFIWIKKDSLFMKKKKKKIYKDTAEVQA